MPFNTKTKQNNKENKNSEHFVKRGRSKTPTERVSRSRSKSGTRKRQIPSAKVDLNVNRSVLEHQNKKKKPSLPLVDKSTRSRQTTNTS